MSLVVCSFVFCSFVFCGLFFKPVFLEESLIILDGENWNKGFSLAHMM